MAKCNFNIDFTEPIETLIEKAKDVITSTGGTFEGDTVRGHYSIPTKLGKITGDYSVSGSSIAFAITDRPGLVGCNRIENELRKYLNSTIPETLLSFD
jgi:hypothetical protein